MCSLIKSVLYFVSVAVCFAHLKAVSIKIEPHNEYKNVGEELKVLCSVPNIILTDCVFDIGNNSYKAINDGDRSIMYYGAGLEEGECGIVIKNITREFDGKVTCKVVPKGEISFSTAHMELIVRKKPSNPFLTFKPQGPYKEGELVTASCEVADGKPGADIKISIERDSSFVGTVDSRQETTDNGTTVTRDVSWNLTAQDDISNISCIAFHDSWAGNIRYSYKSIAVQCKYLGRFDCMSGDLTLYAAGRCVVDRT